MKRTTFLGILIGILTMLIIENIGLKPYMWQWWCLVYAIPALINKIYLKCKP